MKRAIVSFVACLVVAGCASPPPHHKPEVRLETPDAWTAAGARLDTMQIGETTWWDEFEDTVLDTLVLEALVNNFDIMSAAARVEEAAALAKQAGADLYPQVGVGANAARAKQIFLGFPGGEAAPLATRTSSFGVSLDVLWEIDLWGRIGAGQAAFLADMQATWANLAAIRLSIAGQVAKSWFAVIEARQQMELAEQTVASFQLSADQVQRRYEQGVRPALDLRLARANLAAAEALRELREAQLDVSKRQLEIILGRYPAAAIAAAPTLPVITDTIPAGLPSELLLRRPDLLRAERTYAAAEKRITEARRAFFPRITLTGSAGTLSAALEDLVDGDFSVWSIAAGLTQPIFQGGRLKANLSRSHAVSDRRLAEYAVALLGAFGEVETAFVVEAMLARREGYLAEAAEQSEAARLLAERQYDAGIVDYITVLETQRRALTSQIELLLVRRERLDARVNLHLALGGGFDMREDWTQFLVTESNSEGEAPVE